MKLDLSDIRLALHEAISQSLLGMLSEGGDVSEEDRELAEEITDQLLEDLAVEVLGADGAEVTVRVTL